MRRIIFLVLGLSLFASLLAADPAQAQATRTWVSGVGDDANPCSRTAPCKTFAGAISKTAAGGEINCIDAGGFGAVTIVKSMTIDCKNVEAGVVVAGTNGVIVNAAATDVVVLRGLDFMGTISLPGLNGIRVLSLGYLHVEDCIIREFKSAAPNGSGILFQNSTATNFALIRTTLLDNGTGSTGAGILIKPVAGGSVTGTLDQVYVNHNVFGLAADNSGGGAGINVSVKDSTFNGNSQTGIVSITPGGGGGVGVMVMGTTISNNQTGLLVSGANANIRIGSSIITGNGTGVSGTVSSYGTNQFDGNAVNGTLTALPAPALH